MELSWRDNLQVHRNGADFSSQTFAPEKFKNLRLNQDKFMRPTDSSIKCSSFSPTSHSDIYLNILSIWFLYPFWFIRIYANSGTLFSHQQKKGYSPETITLWIYYYARQDSNLQPMDSKSRILKIQKYRNYTSWFQTIYSTDVWFRLELFWKIWLCRAQFGPSGGSHDYQSF